MANDGCSTATLRDLFRVFWCRLTLGEGNVESPLFSSSVASFCRWISDTFSLTNADNAGSAVADVLLRNFAQGRCISQSPQEYPASAVLVSFQRHPIAPAHHFRPA